MQLNSTRIMGGIPVRCWFPKCFQNISKSRSGRTIQTLISHGGSLQWHLKYIQKLLRKFVAFWVFFGRLLAPIWASKNHSKMLIATLSAQNRPQVGSRMLRARKTTTPKSPCWAENVAPRLDYGSDLGAQMATKT